MLRVDQSDWYIKADTLRKQYRYTGLEGDTSVHQLQIDIDATPSILGHPKYHVFFFINPSFWPDMSDGFLVAQLALRENPVDAPFATVRMGHADDGSLLLTPTSPGDANAFLGVISQGQPMRLLLLNGTEKLAELPIPNDEQFKEVAKTYFGQGAPAETPPSALQEDHRNSSDAELNAIFVPLRDMIADFKDETRISWTVILPAVQKLSARLLVKSRGLESARRFYAKMMGEIDRTQNVPSGAFLGVQTPPSLPEHLAQVNALLWKFANDMIAKGYPIEHVAQAYGGFAIMVAEKVVDQQYATWLVIETNRELMSDDFV
jgi:hypothetical protein